MVLPSGAIGGPILANVSGDPSGKTIVPGETPGIIFLMITPAAAHIAGVKMGSPGSATRARSFVSLSRFGMAAISF